MKKFISLLIISSFIITGCSNGEKESTKNIEKILTKENYTTEVRKDDSMIQLIRTTNKEGEYITLIADMKKDKVSMILCSSGGKLEKVYTVEKDEKLDSELSKIYKDELKRLKITEQELLNFLETQYKK